MESEDQQPRPPVGSATGRSSWLLRGLIAVALVAALSAALQALVRSDAATEFLRQMVVRHGSEILGEDLFVEELEVQAILPPQLRLAGVSVFSRQAETEGQPLVHLAEFELKIGRGLSLRDRRIPVAALNLRRLQLRLALVDGRLRDFQTLLERLQAPKSGKPVKIELQGLVVEDASVVVTAAPSDGFLSMSGIQLEFRQDASGSGVGRLLAGEIDVRLGEIRESGRLRPGTFSVDQGVVTLEGYALELGTGRVDLGGVVRVPGGKGSGHQGALTYSLQAQAEIELPRLREAWPKIPTIDGLVRATVGVEGEGAAPHFTFQVQGEEVVIHVIRPKQRSYHAGTSSLVGSFEDGVLRLGPETRVLWGGGQVRLQGQLETAGDFPFSVEAQAQGLRLEELLEDVGVPHSWVELGIEGRVELSGQLKNGLHATGQAELVARDLLVRGGAWDSDADRMEMLHVPVAYVSSGLLLEKDHILLAPARVRGPDSRLDVTCDFLFQRPLGLNIKIQSKRLNFADLGGRIAMQPVQGRGGVSGTVRGPSNRLVIDGELEVGDFVFRRWPFGRVGGHVHWQARSDLEFTGLRGQRGESDFEAEVRLLFADTKRGGSRERLELSIETQVPEGHGRAEDLLPIFFGEVIDMTGPVWGEASLFGPPAELSGSGWAEGRDATYLRERFDSVSLRAEVRDGDLFVDDGFARKSSGHAIFGRGSIGRDREVRFEFRLPTLELAELAPIQEAFAPLRARAKRDGEAEPIAGELSAFAVLQGTLDNVFVDGGLRLENLVYRGTPLGDAQLDITVADHRVAATAQLRDGSLRAQADVLLEGLWPYRVGLDAEGLRLDPYLPRTALTRETPVVAAASGILQGTGTLRDAFHRWGLHLDDLYLERGPHRIETRPERPVQIGYRDGAIHFDSVELVGPEGRTDLRTEGWLRTDGPLDLSVVGPVDIAFLDLLYDVFDRLEARSMVLDLDVSGPSTRSVDVSGTAELRDALIRTIYFPHPVEVDYGRISLRDRRISLDRFEASLGGGAITDAEGSFIVLDRSGYRPRHYGLRATCTDCSLQYPSFLPPARGDLRLNFQGTAPDSLLLGGQVLVEEMVLREPLNWQRSALTILDSATEDTAEEEGNALFAVDLAVESTEGALRISNNLGTIFGTAAGFRVQGDTRKIELVGGVAIDGGTFPWKGREFELEPGMATFKPGGSWFPDMDLSMWADVVSRDETFRITYGISGPLNAPQLRASAAPYLAEADIHNLLLLGMTQQQIAEANLGDLLAVAGASGLGTWGETAATSFRETVEGQGQWSLPDRIEIVPVYTESTGSTALWAVVSKEVVPALLTLEGGVGFAGANTVDTVGRVRLQFLRNLYLEGSWLRDEQASQDYGNFGLDLKLEMGWD